MMNKFCLFSLCAVVASTCFVSGFIPLTMRHGKARSKQLGHKAASMVGTRSMITARPAHEEDEPDLFDYFDPLLSPHAYPNGISPDQKPINEPVASPGATTDFQRTSTRKSVGFKTYSSTSKSSETPSDTRPAVDPNQIFDPTLSPHLYKTGNVPSVIVGDAQATSSSKTVVKVGILLMDHGSKNTASNERLHELARLYQNHPVLRSGLAVDNPSSEVVVRAAHMELASPSVPEAIRSLLEEDDVTEIVCHPFFLSPSGRHAQQDIPRIINDTILELQGGPHKDVPIRLTEPLGASLETMVHIIHETVQQTSSHYVAR